MKKIKLIIFILLIIFLASCNRNNDSKYKIVKNEYYMMKIEQFQKENEVLLNNPNPIDCIFLGDSWTDFYPVVDLYKEITVLNRGIGGDNSYGLLKRLDVSLYQLKPQVVVILIGGNNIYSCEEDIEAIIRDIKANLPNTKIVMQSMYSVCDYGFVNDINRIIELCNYFESLANKYDLTYVDLYHELVDDEQVAIEKYHTEDGVHISNEGYEVITKKLKPVILDLLKK